MSKVSPSRHLVVLVLTQRIAPVRLLAHILITVAAAARAEPAAGVTGAAWASGAVAGMISAAATAPAGASRTRFLIDGPIFGGC